MTKIRPKMIEENVVSEEKQTGSGDIIQQDVVVENEYCEEGKVEQPIVLKKFTQKELLKINVQDLKDICRHYNIPHSKRSKLEIVAAILRYQKTGYTGRKQWVFCNK
jgi:hypothetical protein